MSRRFRLRRFSTPTGREGAKSRMRCSGLFLPRTQPDSQQSTAPSHKVLELSSTIAIFFYLNNRKFVIITPSCFMSSFCHQLLLDTGLIRQSSAGVYHLLPLGMRVLERLVAVVDHHMQAIGGSKMALPILTPATLWKTSGCLTTCLLCSDIVQLYLCVTPQCTPGRWETVGSELFRLKGSTGTVYCLGPVRFLQTTNQLTLPFV